MAEQFKDAYPPNDGIEYVIMRIKSDSTVGDENAPLRMATDEYIRVAKDKLIGNVRDLDKRDYATAGSPEKIKAFKERLGGVVTDIVDETGVQQPGRVVTTSLTSDTDLRSATKETIHVKSGKIHSPTDKNGFRKPAIIKQSVDHVTEHFADNGKRNNMVQPDGTGVFAVTTYGPGRRMMAHESLINNVAENVTGVDGKIIPAEQGYDHKGQPTYQHYKTNGALNNVVEDGSVIYAQSAPNNYGGRTYKSHTNGKVSDPVDADGTQLPYQIETGPEGQVMGVTRGITSAMPTISHFHKDGGLKDAYSADKRSPVVGDLSILEVDTNGQLMNAKYSGGQELTTQQRKDFMLVNGNDLGGIYRQQDIAQQTAYKQKAGMHA